MKVEYRSNNSGGCWWLKDEHWRALEAAGWEVGWYRDKKPEPGLIPLGERWLGALANEASKEFETPAEAMREFERVTGLKVTEEGCGCCGPPHAFEWPEGKNKYGGYASGSDCLAFLFEGVPAMGLREAYEAAAKRLEMTRAEKQSANFGPRKK